MTVNPKEKAMGKAADEIMGECTVRVTREELGEKRHRDRRGHTAREKVTTTTEDYGRHWWDGARHSVSRNGGSDNLGWSRRHVL